MTGMFCTFYDIQIGESDKLNAQVTFQLFAGSPQDKSLEHPDPGERPSARVYNIELWNPDTCPKFQTVRLEAPVMHPYLEKLEQRCLEFLTCH